MSLPLATAAVGAGALSLSLLVAVPWMALAFGLMAAVLLAVAAILGLVALLGIARASAARSTLLALAETEPTPAFLADGCGRLLGANRAAGAAGVDDLAAALAPHLAEAAFDGAVHLLADPSAPPGRTRRVLGREGPARLSVHPAGPDLFLWRLQPEPEAPVPVPRLRFDPLGRLLGTNRAFHDLLGAPPATLADLRPDPPPVPGRPSVLRGGDGDSPRLLVELTGGESGHDLLLLPPDLVPASPSDDAWDAIGSLPVPLMRISADAVILGANPAARALLRDPAAPGTRLSDLLEGLGRPVNEWVADVAAGRPTAGPQVLRGTGDRQDTVLRLSLSPAGTGAARHLLVVLDDVTELKALEAQFVQSQKMQALGQLAGGVAHDFNNLLTAISGHSDLLLLRHDEGDPEYADLVQIRQNVNRAAALVGQLLAFSRKQSMMPETLDLRVVLSDLTHLLNRLVGERVRLTLDHDPTLRFIRADKRQLEQVIMNLVVNARDAMPEGGAIRIETGNRRLEAPLTLGRATVPAGAYVIVRVADEGTGIPPDRLPMIFDPFYTTKKPGEGTGLGLSTVYGIIKQTGGYVFVDSENGRGTTFTLWFPAHDGPPTAAAPVARREVSRPSRPTGTVLLVEDEAPVRAFAARALRLRGHRVLEADCGAAALEQLDAADAPVDLILTDVILPDMDGPTWVRQALTQRPGLRVVFVSGYAEDAFGEQQALIQGSVFLPKPFSLTELTAVVERQMAAGDPA